MPSGVSDPLGFSRLSGISPSIFRSWTPTCRIAAPMPKFDKPLKITEHTIDQENPQGFEQAIAILAHWLVEEYQRKRGAALVPVLRAGHQPDTPQLANANDSAERKLLDIEGLSRYLSMPKSTIYSWVSLKKFPPKIVVRLGRALRFDRDEIDVWIEQQKADRR